jgi:hypothetical protein
MTPPARWLYLAEFTEKVIIPATKEAGEKSGRTKDAEVTEALHWIVLKSLRQAAATVVEMNRILHEEHGSIVAFSDSSGTILGGQLDDQNIQSVAGTVIVGKDGELRRGNVPTVKRRDGTEIPVIPHNRRV